MKHAQILQGRHAKGDLIDHLRIGAIRAAAKKGDLVIGAFWVCAEKNNPGSSVLLGDAHA
jgi:hypothetical protein